MNLHDARAQGATKYDGKPCDKHNSTVRYVKTGDCVQCSNERARAWMKAHPKQA